MSVDVAAVQDALKAEGLDGWLLYDFQGSNPIAARMAGIGSRTAAIWPPGGGSTSSRGRVEPRGLVHAIERHNLDHLPGAKSVYARPHATRSRAEGLLAGMNRVAMEYSPGNAIPYVSRVDAGTVEMVRDTGVAVASSGDLVQRFDGLWDAGRHPSHREAAAEKLYRIKEQAFEEVARRLRGVERRRPSSTSSS